MASRRPCVPFQILTLVGAIVLLGADRGWTQSHFQGEIGPGAIYEIDVPAAWNGTLVVYAHGIVDPSLPVLSPSLQREYPLIRAALLAQGFALAASSFASNGWALADAATRTHQLTGIFVSKVGRPRRTLLLGSSLGALAIVKLVERYPGQYDGALPMCGPLSGALAELTYAGDARVTFDYYFPGLLPGTAFSVAPGAQFLSPLDPGGPSPLFLAVAAALAGNPTVVLQWAIAAKLPFINAVELRDSALFVIGFLLHFTNDFIERVNGKIPYNNVNTVYQVNVSAIPGVNEALSAQLNAGVQRFEADHAARNYYAHSYDPSGELAIPVITLHTTRDPAVPFAHETLFAQKVAAAGRSAFLVQLSVDRWGHCTFTNGEVQTAFASLVRWVETGQKPQ